MKRHLLMTVALSCLLFGSSFRLPGQDWSQTPHGRAGVLMRPLPGSSRASGQVRAGTRAGTQAAATNAASVTFANLWRFRAEQPNVQNLLTKNFAAGLLVMTPDGSGQYNAFFRDYFVAGEAVIQNANDGDSFGASVIFTPPSGGQMDFPPIVFHASYGGSTNCFVGQSVVCGGTSLDVFWVGSAQCTDGPGNNFQFLINGAQAATSPAFYVHPRIEEGNVPTPNVGAYAQGDPKWGSEAYNSDCYTLNTNGTRSAPYSCDGRTGEQHFTIASKGCFMSDGAMLLTYHGYSATPSYSVVPGGTGGLNGYLNGLGNHLGYDSHGDVQPSGLNSFARQNHSSLPEVDGKSCIGPKCDVVLYQDVCTYGPQIIGINHDPTAVYTSGPRKGQLKIQHWVTVVGRPDDRSSWTIEDPAGGVQDTTLVDQGYSNYLAYRAFSGPEFNNPPNAIGIALFSPAELILTDPSGHRLGLDPVTNTSYDEIPNSSYIASFLTDDDPTGVAQGQANAPEVKQLMDNKPGSGQYIVTVTGTDAGTYSMPVYLTDQNGVTNFTELDNIPTSAGVVHKYTFTYTPPFPNSTSGAVALTGALAGNGPNSEANQFLTFASPFVAATLVPAGANNFPIVIFYGPTTDPTSFTASLNGQDVHLLFGPAAGTSQAVNIPLPNGQSTLILQINGTTSSGQIATDTQTLLFDVGGTAPAAPSGLTALAVSPTEINLTWTASPSSGITYSVFRSTTRGFTPSASNQVASGITTTSFSDGGLNVFTKYFYVVEAVDPFATSPASNQATARTQPIVSGGGTVSSITANFNGTAIAGGDTIWFSGVFQPKGLVNAPVVIFVRNSTITFTANGTNYRIPAPDANITFDPSTTTATTSFDGQWQTFAPSGGFAGNTLLDAVEFPVPAGGLPGGIKNVTWTASFSTDTPGISLQWQWASAVYGAFNTSYNALGVKPVDDNKVSQYQNSDHAGTPENYKTHVTGGAMGGGGSNFTGSNSGTTSVNPAVVTSSGGGGPS